MREHPEVEKHLAHRERAEAYRQAVAAWRESGKSLPGGNGRAWTVERAQEMLEAVIALFRIYNRVLWHRFSYCGQCLGGCCVVDAADLKDVDYIALALLEEPLPQRPVRSPVSEEACIYLTPQGCSWPAAWRPIKCATFYCLGSGDWQLDAADARYEEITASLRNVVGERLPALSRYVTLDERALLDLLPDPVAFAGALAARLDDTLVEPIRIYYPALVPEEPVTADPARTREEVALAFIAEAVEELYGAPPSSPDGMTLTVEQLLEDLETLQWVLLGQPAQAATLLKEMVERYETIRPPATGDAPSLWYRMQQQVEALAALVRTDAGPQAGAI